MIGVGVDVVEIERSGRSSARTPNIRERLFTPGELEYAAPQGRSGADRWRPASPPARR